jgi:type III restriction enzyme
VIRSVLAIILDRDSEKWFKPARGKFLLFYRSGAGLEYQPAFVAETPTGIVMLEPKMNSQMTDADILVKKYPAMSWCKLASEYSAGR